MSRNACMKSGVAPHGWPTDVEEERAISDRRTSHSSVVFPKSPRVPLAEVLLSAGHEDAPPSDLGARILAALGGASLYLFSI